MSATACASSTTLAAARAARCRPSSFCRHVGRGRRLAPSACVRGRWCKPSSPPPRVPCAAQAGYAVVFLSRRGSAQPFVSAFQEELGAQTLTDWFQVLQAHAFRGCSLGNSNGSITSSHSACARTLRPHPASQLGTDGTPNIKAPQQQRLVAAMGRATHVLQQGHYLHLPFETLFEYLKARGGDTVLRVLLGCVRFLPVTPPPPPPARTQLLHLLAVTLQPYGAQVLFYLAAAVSDFFMPWPDMVRAGTAGVGRHLMAAGTPGRSQGLPSRGWLSASVQAEHKIQSSDGPLTLTLAKVRGAQLGVEREQGHTPQAGHQALCNALLPAACRCPRCWARCGASGVRGPWSSVSSWRRTSSCL